MLQKYSSGILHCYLDNKRFPLTISVGFRKHDIKFGQVTQDCILVGLHRYSYRGTEKVFTPPGLECTTI